MHIKIVLANILLICLFTIGASQWKQTNGPENGIISGLYIKDSTLYAASQDYVYRSTDKGKKWKQIKNGFLYNSTSCISGKGTYVVAGTTYSGIYQSYDNGDSWSPVRGIVTTIYISSFAWNDSTLFVSGYDGIYKTSDFGKNWTRILTLNTEARALSVFSEDSVIISGIEHSGVKVSMDFGKTWDTMNEGLGNRSVNSFCRLDSILYAGTDSGLYAMTKYDGVWKIVDTTLAKSSISSIIKFNNKLLASTSRGILATENHWKKWEYLIYRQWSTTFLSLGIIGNDIFAGTNSRGVIHSSDLGKTWNQTGVIVKKVTVECLAVRDSILLEGDGYGVHISTNEGESWSDISTDTVDAARTVAIQDSFYFAGNYWGCFSRKIGESHWKTILMEPMVNSIKTKGESLYVATSSGLYFSPKYGDSISVLDSGSIGKVFHTLGVFDNTILVNTEQGIFISSDNGKHWNLRNPKPDIYWAADFAKKDSFYYAATGYGIFRMSEGDTVWKEMNAGLGTTLDVASFCFVGKNIFLGMRGYGIAYSTNMGENWTSGNSNDTKYFNVFGIVTNDRNIFFGGPYTSVWSRPLSDLITPVASINEITSKNYHLSQNYPNPFNPTTTINYALPKAGNVVLKVYDILGKEVATLVNDYKELGRYQVDFDASKLSSGMYIYKLTSDKFTEVKKMLLLR